MLEDQQHVVAACPEGRVWRLTVGPFIAILLYTAAVRLGSNCEANAPLDNKGAKLEAAFDAHAAVASLENHNPRPLLIGPGPDRDAVFDERYDWSEYGRDLKVIADLADHAENAWPQMVEHLDDNRYCTTLWFPGSSVRRSVNESVGDVCRMIIKECLSTAYRRRLFIGLRGEMAKVTYGRLIGGGVPSQNDPLKVWCERRRDKVLYELQIETCEWVVSQVPNVPRLSPKDQAMIVDAIKADIESLRKAQRAVRFEGFNFHGQSIRAFSAETAQYKR